jgi:hypothetical protein
MRRAANIRVTGPRLVEYAAPTHGLSRPRARLIGHSGVWQPRGLWRVASAASFHSPRSTSPSGRLPRCAASGFIAMTRMVAIGLRTLASLHDR